MLTITFRVLLQIVLILANRCSVCVSSLLAVFLRCCSFMSVPSLLIFLCLVCHFLFPELNCQFLSRPHFCCLCSFSYILINHFLGILGHTSSVCNETTMYRRFIVRVGAFSANITLWEAGSYSRASL